MANQRGWWQIDWHPVDGLEEKPFILSEADLEHIAAMVRSGFTEGEIVYEEEDENLTEDN